VALSDQVARLEVRQGNLEREQSESRAKLGILSIEIHKTSQQVDAIVTTMESLERVVHDMAKKDEIADAVAAKMQQYSRQKWTRAQRIAAVLGGLVATCTMIGLWVQIYATMAS